MNSGWTDPGTYLFKKYKFHSKQSKLGTTKIHISKRVGKLRTINSMPKIISNQSASEARYICLGGRCRCSSAMRDFILFCFVWNILIFFNNRHYTKEYVWYGQREWVTCQQFWFQCKMLARWQCYILIQTSSQSGLRWIKRYYYYLGSTTK